MGLAHLSPPSPKPFPDVYPRGLRALGEISLQVIYLYQFNFINQATLSKALHVLGRTQARVASWRIFLPSGKP